MYIKWDTTCKVFLNCKIACKYTLLLLAYFCWIINLIGWWLCYVYDILFYIIIQVQSLCWCVLERMCWWYLERGKRRKYTAFGCQNRIFIVMKQTINAMLAKVNNHCCKKVKPEQCLAFEDNEQMVRSHNQKDAGSLTWVSYCDS